MSEKRFTMSYAYDDEEYEYFDNGVPLTPSETCRMLNVLNDENEHLRKRNKFLEEFDGRAETFANLKEENEKLRQENAKLKKEVEETVRWTGYE